MNSRKTFLSIDTLYRTISRVSALTVFIALLQVVVLSAPSHAFAQGSHLCRWNGSSCETYSASANCDGGFEPGNDCFEIDNQSLCETASPTCIASSGFGGPDQTCRAGGSFESRCNPGLVCVDGVICKTGGIAGGPCLPGRQCDSGLVCNSANKCQSPQASETNVQIICNTSTGKIDPKGEGINTAIGCIPFSPTGLAKFFLGWALGIGGGIALLMIGWASIIIMTSSGDPKKVQGGKELLTAAVSGLLLMIFSTFILRFFGITLFEIF